MSDRVICRGPAREWTDISEGASQQLVRRYSRGNG